MPYERPPLSKDVLLGTAEPPRMRKPGFYTDRSIRLMTHRRVRQILPATRRLIFDDGSEIAYGHLLIATGSRSRVLEAQGSALAGITSLRSDVDALRLRAALRPGKNVVIVGAGYIGLEVAAAASQAGCSVCVIERGERALSRVAPSLISSHFQRLHESHGVRFLFGRDVLRFDGSSHVEQVITGRGEVLPADLVVIGIGVQAEDTLAREAGLECNDGIIVDNQCRTSEPLIYAAGDVARFHHPLAGTAVRLESIPNALSQAERAVDSILGRPVATPEVPWFWTTQHDTKLQSAGFRGPSDTAIVRGNLSSASFSIVHLRDARITAIDAINAGSDFLAARRAMSTSRLIDVHRLADAALPLSESILQGQSCPAQ